MRWISGVAILFYLAILCTPQAFAVQDLRLSPLADSQLYALSQSQQQALVNITADNDDTPPLLPANTGVVLSRALFTVTTVATFTDASSPTKQPQQPRAPPLS